MGRNLASPLLRWFDSHKRPLPWRNTRDPYAVWVSEIMLQQTRVDTVAPYYRRFLRAFPTLRSLANAPLGRVLKLWEGLGYYARARNLRKAAQTVMRDHGGRLPADYDALLKLPGVGRYTAGAIASIAFGLPHPVLDGNVKRVLARLFAVRGDIRKSATLHDLWAIAAALLPREGAGEFNQALMELGATVCLPDAPFCPKCPVRAVCLAFHFKETSSLPVSSARKPVPRATVAAGVIWHRSRVLIAQRPLHGLLGGLWEFPGGKREPRESLPACLKREIREELGIEIAVHRKLLVVRHAYSHLKVTLHFFDCRYVSGSARALGCAAYKWVRPADLSRYAFPAANHPVLRLLQSAHRPRIHS